MRVSEQKVNPHLEKQIFATLYRVVADLNTPSEVKTFLQDILAENELKTVAKRLAIAYWIQKGRGFSNIKDNLKVSPATISMVQGKMPKAPGLKLALKKIEADEWATHWARKIKRLAKKI